MGNSTTRLSDIVDEAGSLGDVSPALATGGWSDSVSLGIANDVITAMLLGGPNGQPFNWKWNRFNPGPFPTISWQQDYFSYNVSLGWLENSWASNVNQTSIPKQKLPVEVRKDLDVTYTQTGYPGKLCWLPNDQLQYGVWGDNPQGPTAGNTQGQINTSGPSGTGMQNPGPGVIYTYPIGTLLTPVNATTCIVDPYNQRWVLSTFGTCGMVQPTWPNPSVYPTYAAPNTAATTVTDGTCVWTAVDPKGQGFRLNPIPPQSGVVWLIQPIGQLRIPKFTTLSQFLEPVPDDWVSYFKTGFFCQCYRRNPDPKIRARFKDEYNLWMKALHDAYTQGNREADDYGFYPGSASVMSPGFVNVIRPDFPYGPY